MKTRNDPFDRHAFNALYGFRCDCARCISPADRAAKEALHRMLRPRGEP